MERRQELLDKAHNLDALIVEDDYEFEMSFLEPPSPALKSMDVDGRVIYVGSFSKSLFPGMRLGYLVGSEPFIREARALRTSVLRHPPGHIQRTAAYFLSMGHYDAQIRKMSAAMHTRREEMQTAITTYGLEIAGQGAFGGSSYWMRAPARIDTRTLASKLKTNGVLIEPGHAFFTNPEDTRSYYRLGYSSIQTDRINPGIALIAEQIRS